MQTDLGPMPKIFVIGPNKCATTTIHRLLNRSGVPSLHWKRQGRPLVFDLLTNLTLGRRPFAGYEDFVAFTDINHINNDVCVEGAIHFPEFDRHYPGSYFILNTRDVEDWVRSRVKHGWLDRTVKLTGLSPDEVMDGWRKQFVEHEANVRAHFGDSPRLLEFNIDRDDPSGIARFLAPHYAVDLVHWGKRNASDGVAEKEARLAKLQGAGGGYDPPS